MTDPVSWTQDIIPIYDILRRLGLSASHSGFFHTSYAVYLALRRPQLLILPSHWLYPRVAALYNTSSDCVMCSVFSSASLAWHANRPLLEHLAQRPLPLCPGPAAFLAILAAAFHTDEAA